MIVMFIVTGAGFVVLVAIGVWLIRTYERARIATDREREAIARTLQPKLRVVRRDELPEPSSGARREE